MSKQGEHASIFVTKALEHEALKDFTGDELLRRASDMSSHCINYLKRKGMFDPSAFDLVDEAGADGEHEGSDPPYVEADDVEAVERAPQPIATDPEPTATDPEPTATDPQPTATDPQPTATDPHPTATDPCQTESVQCLWMKKNERLRSFAE